MKKAIAIAALCCAAMGMNAQEPVVYDFNHTPDFFPYLQAPVPDGMGQTGNFEFIKNTGAVGVPYGVGAGSDELLTESYTDESGAKKWRARTDGFRVRISFMDGISYGLTPEGKYVYEGMELDKNYPFLGYGDKGPTRVLWMPGWGSEDAWADKDYDAAVESDWVSTKNAIAFNRGGNNASRTDTWIQFPKFQGPFTCTYYISSQSDSNRNKEQPLRCRVVPVNDSEVEMEELAQITERPYAEIMNKRYYKMTYVYTGTDAVALRIGANGAQLGLFHVVFTSGADDSALEDVIVTPADENAPIYNIMGQRVGADYKGLVIKNGVKYIQK